jgi:putative ABC transport system substrate-binding protein
MVCAATTTRIAGVQDALGAIRKIGVVTLGVPQSAPIFLAFVRGLRELGYEPGRNIILEFRYAQGRADKLPGLIAEVFAHNIEVLVVESIAAAVDAKNASRTIPIVVAIASDPVGAGVFESLAHPGGNMTGLSLQSEEITEKRIQLLKELLPTMSRLAVVYNPNRPTIDTNIKEVETAAGHFRLDVQRIPLASPDNVRVAFEQVVTARSEAIMTLPDGMLLNQAKPIGELVRRAAFHPFFQSVTSSKLEV